MPTHMKIPSFLKTNAFAQLLKFLFVGGSITLFYVGGVWLGTTYTNHSPLIINSLFYCSSAIVGYLLNYYWSFKSEKRHVITLIKYLVLTGTGVAVNTIYAALILSLFKVEMVYISLSFSMFWPFISFFGQKHFVYK